MGDRAPNRSIPYSGLITPNESFSTAGTITPKQEEDNYQTQVIDLRSALPFEMNSLQIPTRDAHHSPPQPSMAPQIPGASLQIVGQKVNLLVNAIEELRKLGLKEIDTELPELVLVGDQSAGKSTLMGAIAEINLPKDTGMCTRCPANIKTSPAETWSCTVSLHEYYWYSNDMRRVPTKAQPFPPWRANDGINVRPFKTIADKAELENILRWAQIALLNPNQDYHAFIPGTGAIAQNGLEQDYKHEADFSPNIVAIEISGPGLPALSFYDLPGIFVSAATKDEQYLIKVFENLAAKYIRHENALVICAMTMANDPGLSRTRAIIEYHKAEKRTIGVLTMPDRLQEGSTHRDYDAILKGMTHSLPRGYFVTKQPGPGFLPQRDYHSQAREEEELFFNTDPRWTGEWKNYRDRCGTAAIQAYLSQEFARLIAQSMPSIDEKIKAQAQHVNAQLSRLPELPNDNVQHVVRQCLQEFSNGVRDILEGGHDQNQFLSDWSQLSIDFADAIQKIKPMFIITDGSDQTFPEIINVDDDSDNSKMSSTQASPYKRANEDPFSPSAKRQNLMGSFKPKVEEGSSNISPSIPRHNTSKKRSTPFDAFLNAGKRFMTIAEVRRVISKHRRPGHPDNVSDAAREEICLLSIQSWNQPLKKLADTTFHMLQTAIMGAMESSLGQYKQTDLFRKSKRKILELLGQHQAEQRRILEEFYALETYKLFTVNNEDFIRYKTEELSLLKEKRRQRRVSCYVQRQNYLSKKTLTETAKIQQEKAVTDEQLGPDPFGLEIETAAYVRGYYKTAGHRFADNVCQSILGNTFRKIHLEIPHLLENYLDLNTGDGEIKCRNLMVEDHGEAAQRAALQAEKMKLSHAAERLAKLVEELGINPDAMDIDQLYDQPADEPFHSEQSSYTAAEESRPYRNRLFVDDDI